MEIYGNDWNKLMHVIRIQFDRVKICLYLKEEYFVQLTFI